MLLSDLFGLIGENFNIDTKNKANPVKPGVESSTSSIDVIDTTPNGSITAKVVEAATAQSSAPVTINILNMTNTPGIVPTVNRQPASETPVLDAVIDKIVDAVRTAEEELAEDAPVGEDVPALSINTDAYGPISANMEVPDELRIASMSRMQRTPDVIQLGPNMLIPRNLVGSINDQVEETGAATNVNPGMFMPQVAIQNNDNTFVPSIINPNLFAQPRNAAALPSVPQQHPEQQYAQPIVPQVASPVNPEYVDISLDVIPRDLPKPAAAIDRVPAAPPVAPAPPAVAMIDNAAMIRKYPYLEPIEAIALKTQQQIHFYDIPRNGVPDEMSGIIKADVYFSNGTINPYKGFYIDTGMLYDSRVKIFPAVDGINVFEMAPCYVLKNTDKTTKKEIFNTKMVEELLVGGYQAITEKELYYENWKELNRYIALISMPTKRMNAESRKSTQNVLKALHSAGVLEEAKRIAPNTRLVFSNAYKGPNDFVLTNVNLQTGQWVPEFFGHAPVPSVPLEIHVEGKKATIMTLGPDIEGIRKNFDIDTRIYKDDRTQRR